MQKRENNGKWRTWRRYVVARKNKKASIKGESKKGEEMKEKSD